MFTAPSGSKRLWFVALVLLVALVAASCAAGDATTTLPSLGEAGSADDAGTESTDSSAADGEVADSEQALLAVSQCMRDAGVDGFPDPIVDSEGIAQIDRTGLGDAGIDPQSESFRSAFEQCGELLDGVTLGAGRFGADQTETQDMLLELSSCMRREGITDFPDGDLSGANGPGVGPFGDAIDLDDPAIAAAMDTCQAEVNLPDFGGARGGE